MKPSDRVRKKLIEQGICSSGNEICVRARRYSTYRREFNWLPRSEVVEKCQSTEKVYLTMLTVSEMAQAHKLTVKPLGWFGDWDEIVAEV